MFAVRSYHGMLAVCLALGVAKGVRTVYMNLVIPTHVPIERLAAASGLQMVVNGVFLMSLGPIVGKNESYFSFVVQIIEFSRSQDSFETLPEAMRCVFYL